MTFGGTSLGCCASGRPRCLVRLLFKRCSLFLLFFFSLILVIILILVFFPFTVKERPDLESKFDERVQAAVKYTRTIEDFNELIDPRTLARHCLCHDPNPLNMNLDT